MLTQPSRPSAFAASDGRPDVLVVGGGIIGLAVADELARRGLRVELWEREATTGALEGGGASGASAGMLAPLAEVPDDREFFEVCRSARDLWSEFAPALESDSGIPLDYDRSGALVLDLPGSRLTALRAAATEYGEPHELLDWREARRLVPDLAGDPDGAGALLHLPGEHRIDNRQVCAALARRLAARHVTVRTGRRLLRLETSPRGVLAHADGHRLETAHVVLATGAWSAGNHGPFADLAPSTIFPVRGQMLRFQEVDWPFTGCLRGGHFYTARRRGGGLLLGATVEPEAGFNATVTGAGVESLLGFARRHLPGLLRRPLTDSWAGLRPGSFDGRPLVGPLGDGVWLAAGHYRNGVLLAPWTARLLGSWLAEGRRPEAVAALFDPRRAAEAAGAAGTAANPMLFSKHGAD